MNTSKNNLGLGAAIFSVVGLSLVLGFLATRPVKPSFVAFSQPRLSFLVQDAVSPAADIVEVVKFGPIIKAPKLPKKPEIKVPHETPHVDPLDPLDPLSGLGDLGD